MKNVLAQATVIATAGSIEAGHLPGHVGGAISASDLDFEPVAPLAPVTVQADPPPREPAAPEPAIPSETGARNVEDGLFIPVGNTLEDIQRAYTLKTLESCNNNKTQAAKLLNVSRKALYDKLVRWGDDKSLVQ